MFHSFVCRKKNDFPAGTVGDNAKPRSVRHLDTLAFPVKGEIGNAIRAFTRTHFSDLPAQSGSRCRGTVSPVDCLRNLHKWERESLRQIAFHCLTLCLFARGRGSGWVMTSLELRASSGTRAVSLPATWRHCQPIKWSVRLPTRVEMFFLQRGPARAPLYPPAA